MKWRRIIAVMLVPAIAIALWIAIPGSSPTDPKVNGRRLSVWMRETAPAPPVSQSPAYVQWQLTLFRQNRTRTPTEQAAFAAISKLGSNAVPYLLHTAYDSDSRLKSNVIRWCRQRKAIRISFESADERRLYALSSLSELGPLALAAWVDMITNRFSNPRARGFAYWELQKLGESARPACPVLLNVYHDADATSRAAIREILYRCDTDGVLLPCLNLQEGEDLIIRAQAAHTLGELAGRAETAVPALIIALHDSDPWVRQATLEALAQFQTKAVSAVGAIRSCLIDPEPEVREAATNALRKIAVDL